MAKAQKELPYQNLTEGLLTLERDGSVPDTRMKDAWRTRDVIMRAIRLDMQERDWKRSRLKGLVDGNPPYDKQKMIDANRSDECNVNWRRAKRFLEGARGMVYDVFSEAATYSTIQLTDRVKNCDEKSRIVTEEFQELLEKDIEHDFTNQQSQGQMVLYGTGPQVFTDEYDWRQISIESKALFVPEMAPSNVNRWEWAAIIQEYTPDRLYARIQNPQIAQRRGWDVPATRRTIMNAHPLSRTGVMYQNWSYHQDILKNGTYYYNADQSKKCRLAHFYFREFPQDGEEEGKITECLLDLDAYNMTEEQGQLRYLFLSHRKYEQWQNVIHPMYWNHDINGYHHSVTGLGIEMFSALEYQNRLLCRIADDAFAPDLLFKPKTASDREKMSIAPFGRYGVIPASLELVQQNMQKFLQEKIVVNREIEEVVQENLSQFRSQAMQKQQGNPITAAQVQYEASEAAKMGKTQLTRIYEQMDWLYAEKYRRATNPKMSESCRGGKLAMAFMKRCEERGVTAEEMRETQFVRATRVVGQGSGFMRQQSLEFLLGLVAMLPEGGRANLVKEVIASRAGQSKVAAFWPDPQQDDSMLAQQSDAMQQMAGMKAGVPPIFVPTQNPLVYATTFLQAADGAQQAIQQGADPHEGSSFLDLAIPAIGQHLGRMQGDKTRESMLKGMSEKLTELQSFNDQVKGQLQQNAQKQAEAQQKMAQVQSGQDPETQIGLAKVQSKHQIDLIKLDAATKLKTQKQNVDLGLKSRQMSVDAALKDATTAHDLHLNRLKTVADIQVNKAKAAAAAKNGKPAKSGKA